MFATGSASGRQSWTREAQGLLAGYTYCQLHKKLHSLQYEAQPGFLLWSFVYICSVNTELAWGTRL